MADADSKSSSEKKKPIGLPATEDVVCLLNRIRRKYLKAEMTLNPSDDSPVSPPGDSQILRAGLIKLDASLDVSKPEEVLAMVDCARKKPGPQAEPDGVGSKNTPTDTPARKGLTKLPATRSPNGDSTVLGEKGRRIL